MLRPTTLLIALTMTTSAFAYESYQQLWQQQLNQDRQQFQQQQLWQQQQQMQYDKDRFQDQQRLDRLDSEIETDRLIDSLGDD